LTIPNSVKSILFGTFDVPQFLIDDLSKLTKVESLSFRVTTFNETLNLNPLKALTKVKSLSLDNSRFMAHVETDIPENLIDKFTNLKDLTISEYALNQNNINKISSQTKLESLSLVFCSYRNVDNIDSFKNLKKLKTLIIENYMYVPLKIVSKYIYTLTKLKKLVINNQREISFPSSKTYNIGKLEKLEYIDLNINNFSFNLKDFGNLEKLKYLSKHLSFINDLYNLFLYKYHSMHIFYLTSEEEINDKINNYIFTFLLGGTLAFNELQIDEGERRRLKEQLYSSSGSSVPYMLGLAEFLTKSMPIISSSMELLFDWFSKTFIVTESVDVVPIRHRNIHIPYTGSNAVENSLDSWESSVDTTLSLMWLLLYFTLFEYLGRSDSRIVHTLSRVH